MNEHHTFFLSHASENKAYARELKKRLENLDYTVWFDQDKILLSNDLEEVINKGITHSMYGIVVLSHDYLDRRKKWTAREFEQLIENHDIYIILYNIKLDDIKRKYRDIYEVIENKLVATNAKDFDYILEGLKEILEKRIEKDFFNLYKYLSEREWKAADIETYNLIRKKRLLNFPDEDLMKLSSLWCICSNNLYGFKIQQQIYQREKSGNNYLISYHSFRDTVEWGWRHWTDIFDDNFHTGYVPQGHLPRLVYFRDELNCPVHGDAPLKPADFEFIKRKDSARPQLFAWLISLVICSPLAVIFFPAYLVVSFCMSLVLFFVVAFTLPAWWERQRAYILHELFTKHDFQKTGAIDTRRGRD